MQEVYLCKNCKSPRVQVFRVPKKDGKEIVFVWCRECNSVNEGERIEFKKEEVKNEAR